LTIFTRRVGNDPVGAVGKWVERIFLESALHLDQLHEAESHRQSKADNIDEREQFMFPQTAYRDFEVVLKHG
jgi:hypothetical protein